MEEQNFTATELQRNAFEALKIARAEGAVFVHHKTLGSFKITPEPSVNKINFGVLSGQIDVLPGAFKDWSRDVEDDFGL